MDSRTFKEFAKNQILMTTIRINDQLYPVMPTKFPPICCVTFDDEGLAIHELNLLTNKEKDSVLEFLPYSAIEMIELNPVKKITAIMSITVKRFHLDLRVKLFFQSDFLLHFECEDLTVLEALSKVLTTHGVEVKDSFGMIQVFERANSNREACDYLDKNLDRMAEERKVDIFRMRQTEE